MSNGVSQRLKEIADRTGPDRIRGQDERGGCQANEDSVFHRVHWSGLRCTEPFQGKKTNLMARPAIQCQLRPDFSDDGCELEAVP